MMKTATLSGPSIIHWFRRDLRTHDNAALASALKLSSQTKRPLVAVYILSPAHVNPSVCGAVRARFLLDTLRVLRENLRRHHNANLQVATGNPRTLLPDIARECKAEDVFWEHELAPEPRARDAHVRDVLAHARIRVHATHGFTLYDPDELLRRRDAPRNMTGMLSLIAEVGDPPDAMPRCSISLSEETRDGRMSSDVPTLESLGYDDVAEGWEVFAGGEDEGLGRMDEFMGRENGRVAAQFEKPKTSPAAIKPRETSILSPYLALGVISSRVFHERLREMEKKHRVGKVAQTRLWGQLIWREHFWLLAYSIKKFDRMRGNVLCRQIDWDEGEESDERLRKWETGQTGYPWIDALMTQLRTEGFVHHLGRHSLACFLTRGDLWVSWERGAKVFEKYLIDYDYALNSANWMWLSCSAFFAMYLRVYSPVRFAKKWDKDGEFIKHYVPVLKKMPKAYIHEPWKAPKEVQRQAGCVIGRDYPEAMVDHQHACKENIKRMKQSYEKREFGDAADAEDDGDARERWKRETGKGEIDGRRKRQRR